MTWTAADIPDQEGRTVVVTGANTGLGKAATRLFAANGAEVILTCRNIERGQDAQSDIEATTPDGSLTVRELDLADLSSITSFADAFTGRFGELDVLANNAGVMAIPRRETADGFEQQFGVNHLGHFALTGRLLDALQAAGSAADPARVVTMSSRAHVPGQIDFEDIHGETGYNSWNAYSQSKLANLLFAYELDRRLDAADMPIDSLGAHPGWSATELQARGPEMMGSRVRQLFMRVANSLFAQDPAQGVLPLMYAATMPDVNGGEYYGPGGFLNMRGYPEKQRSSSASYDETVAKRLWERSEALTGVEYELLERGAINVSVED